MSDDEPVEPREDDDDQDEGDITAISTSTDVLTDRVLAELGPGSPPATTMATAQLPVRRVAANMRKTPAEANCTVPK